MTLIDEWKSAWRLLSVQANTLGVALSGTYVLMYDQLKETLPPLVMAIITGAVFALGIIGRLVAQKPKDPGQP